MKHPMQPVERDEVGTIRFKKNQIVRFLCDTSSDDLNRLSLMGFSREDWQQFYQLLGYSVSGFGDLNCADSDLVAAADKAAEELMRVDFAATYEPVEESAPASKEKCDECHDTGFNSSGDRCANTAHPRRCWCGHLFERHEASGRHCLGCCGTSTCCIHEPSVERPDKVG